MASSSSACTVPSVYCFARRKPKACGRPCRLGLGLGLGFGFG